MRGIKIVAVVAVMVVVAAGAVILATSGDNEKADGGPVTLTDYLGREVTVISSERIISQSSAPTAILCGLGASSNLVGVSSDDEVYAENPYVIGLTQDDFPQAINDGLGNGTIKALGPMYNMSAETIVSIESDLVVLDVYGSSPEIRAALDTLGVTYVVVAVGTIDEIFQTIDILGKAVGKEPAAAKMTSEIKSAIKKISDWCESIVVNERGGQKFNVALMMTASYAIGPEYIGGEILESLHVENAFSGVGRYAPVSKESIAQADPDVLIYQNLGMGDGVTDPAAYVQSVYSDPVLGKVSAAENGLVFTTVGGAKNATSHANQGIVRAYAIFAMFIYQDYLTFEISDVFDSDNYIGYMSKFWEMVDS